MVPKSKSCATFGLEREHAQMLLLIPRASTPVSPQFLKRPDGRRARSSGCQEWQGPSSGSHSVVASTAPLVAAHGNVRQLATFPCPASLSQLLH